MKYRRYFQAFLGSALMFAVTYCKTDVEDANPPLRDTRKHEEMSKSLNLSQEEEEEYAPDLLTNAVQDIVLNLGKSSKGNLIVGLRDGRVFSLVEDSGNWSSEIVAFVNSSSGLMGLSNLSSREKACGVDGRGKRFVSAPDGKNIPEKKIEISSIVTAKGNNLDYGVKDAIAYANKIEKTIYLLKGSCGEKPNVIMLSKEGRGHGWISLLSWGGGASNLYVGYGSGEIGKISIDTKEEDIIYGNPNENRFLFDIALNEKETLIAIAYQRKIVILDTNSHEALELPFGGRNVAFFNENNLICSTMEGDVILFDIKHMVKVETLIESKEEEVCVGGNDMCAITYLKRISDVIVMGTLDGEVIIYDYKNKRKNSIKMAVPPKN